MDIPRFSALSGQANERESALLAVVKQTWTAAVGGKGRADERTMGRK